MFKKMHHTISFWVMYLYLRCFLAFGNTSSKIYPNNTNMVFDMQIN